MRNGFKVVKKLPIDEIGVQMTLVEHESSGTQILHLGSDDPENLFCLAFQTWPESSNGVAHILEHTVLCGSEKYPVKDPFFGMIKRSLNTFMNALTGDDITYYPASSQVPQDFYNLLDVYVDAVFFPKLDELSFSQEGHRLEYATPDDPSSGLQRKGIVFNEMKGALGSSEARTWYKLMEALFPDTPYRHNSGGDPHVIPELTYDQLKEFHHTHYAPSRCLFFFSGNLPLDDHLAYLEERVLGKAEKLPPIPLPDHQPRFSAPRKVEGTFPATEGEEKLPIVKWGWLTCSGANHLEILALEVIDLALTATDASPLRQAMLRSGLCAEMNAYVCGDMLDVPIIIACKGVSDVDGLEKVMTDKLSEIAKEGIDAELIESSIHQLEIDRLEICGSGGPYGLTLFRRSAAPMLLGADPEAGLSIVSLFKGLRERLAKPGAIQELVSKYLVNNTHHVRVTMSPDVGLGAREEALEKAALEACQAKIDPALVVADAKRLQAYQELHEGDDVDLLPKVTSADVSKEPQTFALKESSFGPLNVFHHACHTNSIVYAGLLFDLPHINDDELVHAHFFASLLCEVGCGGRDYASQLNYLMEHTGGVHASLGLYPQGDDPRTFRPSISISGKALSTSAGDLLGIFKDIVQTADFTDRERMKELLKQYGSALEHGLNQSAMHYATDLAVSAITPGGRVNEEWHGISLLHAIRPVVANLDAQIDTFIAKMVDLQGRLLGGATADLILSCDEATEKQLERDNFYGLGELAGQSRPKWEVPNKVNAIESQGRIISAPVAFTCRTLPGLPYAHADAPNLSLAAKIFNHKVLHPTIREKGGAYGGGAVNDIIGEAFYFYAYRDPHLHASLNAFDLAVNETEAGNFTDRDLESAKLTLLQRMDGVVTPGTRGGAAYTWLRKGMILEMRRAYRAQILNATRDDIMGAVSTHLKPKMDDSIVVSFAGKDLLERENKLLKNPLHIFPA